MTDNRSAYSTSEFERWAHGSGLGRAERNVIDSYLGREGPTLEAGTGGGRIVSAMAAMGFRRLAGFDYVPGMIDEAIGGDTTGSIAFSVQDAVHLDYPDESFAQLLYLQHLACFTDTRDGRQKILAEAYRVLRPGGVAVFSFLSFQGRQLSASHRLYARYLRVLRGLRRAPRSIQAQPWLRVGGRPNPGLLVDRGPYVYWYRAAEAVADLEAAGFVIRRVGTQTDAVRGVLRESVDDLSVTRRDTTLYVVCRRAPVEG